MKILTTFTATLILIGPLTFADSLTKEASIDRGRYLIKVTGCNDCHTPQYGLKGGEVSEKDWLIGDRVGWKGPWGVTYGINIRTRVLSMTETEFLKYAKVLRTRPPMPWYSLNSMNDRDLRSIYRYIQYLGPHNHRTAEPLPPGKIPVGPYMDMTVIMPNPN